MIVSTRPCPPSILAQCKNAAACVKVAEANGWEVATRVAVDDDGVWYITVNVRKDGSVLSALWTDGSFIRCWTTECPWRLGYRELVHAIKGTEPVPTAKAQALLDEEQQSMLAAIDALAQIAAPVRVIRLGTSTADCKGHYFTRGRLGRIPCSKHAAPGGTLCGGPCGWY